MICAGHWPDLYYVAVGQGLHVLPSACVQKDLPMPTILRAGPFRFFFFASDGREPPHVHVERDEKLAKFWLSPVRIQSSGGFGRNELNRIKNIVVTHEQELLESWRDYFSN